MTTMPEQVRLRPRACEPWTDLAGARHQRLRVAHPAQRGRYLSEDGELVQLSTYWRRRLNAGDVEIVPEERAERAEKRRSRDDG